MTGTAPHTGNEPSPVERFDAWLALTGRAGAPAGPLRLPMLSGSMQPALPPGSLLTIEPCGAAGFARGDVVVFVEDDRLVAHRVLLRLRLPGLDVVLEKGDANPRGAWRRAGTVRGVVRGAQRPDGQAADLGGRERASRGLRRHLRSLLSRRP